MLPIANAQSGEVEIVEEIQATPDKKKGEWTIGGVQITAKKSTNLDSGHSPKPGRLARVKYEIQEGQVIASEIEPLKIDAADITDGPHVIWQDATTAELITFANGQASRRIEKGLVTPRIIDGLAGPESSITLDPNAPVPQAAILDMPEKLLAISDLEGNYFNALRFLQNNNVLDEDGHWDWGKGHLVLIGDLVDRGSMVTELMWMIRRLEREAETAGGKVHYVLGNHEAMVMAGDLRYIVDKYRFVTHRMGLTYDRLYAPDSEIGRWWRTKNGIMKIGDLLFVHAGYSPMLDQYGLDIDSLNQRIRAALPPVFATDGSNPAADPVGHKHGLFWYRGYFEQHGEEWGGQATPEQIEKILMRHNAKHIVIGHSVVEEVGSIDDEGYVIGIDVEWAKPNASQGLLVENEKLWRLNMQAEREEILNSVRN